MPIACRRYLGCEVELLRLHLGDKLCVLSNLLWTSYKLLEFRDVGHLHNSGCIAS